MMSRRARHLGQGLLVTCAGAGLLVLLVGRFVQDEVAPQPTLGEPVDMRIEGMRTVVYGNGAPRLTASARSVQPEPVRAIGPLRIGFAQSIVASDVHIELLASAADGSEQLDLVSSVKDAGSALTREVGGITSAELHELTITRRDDAGTRTVLQARRCRTEARARVMTCWKGVLFDGDEVIPFAQAVHDGRRWHITRGVRASRSG